MKKIIFLFILISSNLFGQTFYSKIKENTFKDNPHKDKPAYIEIDTAVIKNPDDVIIYYNSELIKRDGNRFYLSSKPFSEDKSSTLTINLTEKGDAALSKYLGEQKKTKHYSTNELNVIHEKDNFKMYANDTVLATETYTVYLELDSTKFPDLKKVSVFFYTVPIKNVGYRYKISYIPPPMPGDNEYEIRIIKKEKKRTDTLKFTHSVFVKRPSATKSAESKPIDYETIPQIMPVFNSTTYKNFDDYFIQSLRKENIKLQGKIFMSYTVMVDGSTRFEQIRKGAVSDADKIKIKEIVENYKGWTLGMDNGKQVNVNISPVYNFK